MEKFTISTLAKTFKVSRQTLLYYDKIGLLKPEYKDDRNDYRYYSYKQVLELSFIIFLKQGGFSLNDIKEYVNCRNMDESMDFLSKKEVELSDKIKKLKKIRKQIKNKIQNLQELSSEVEDLPIIEIFSEKYLMEIELKKDYSRYEMEAAFLQIDKEAEKYKVEDYNVSVTIKMSDIKKSNFSAYSSPSFTLPKKIKGARIIEEQLAGSIIHRGSFDLIGESYKKLLKYIESEGYAICGDSVEFSNKNTVYLGDEKVGALTKIVIPICKKS